MRVILACGGTGGHINPAIAIANAVRAAEPDSEILFVGAKVGMEGELVKKAGYPITFIDIEGFRRSLSLQNLRVAVKIGVSLVQSRRILRRFRPDIVVGTGGYVSGPVLLAASKMKLPTLIHEQNAFAGFTTRLLSGHVDKICVAFPGVKRLEADSSKVVLTGNPIRSVFGSLTETEAKRQLGVDDGKPFVICFGGSLGAKKINECMVEYIKQTYQDKSRHLLLVTGMHYYDAVRRELSDAGVDLNGSCVYLKSYLDDIHRYLTAGDVIICRSGAISISEINYLGKAAILIPSPNVTDNHQEFNADAAVAAGGAVKLSETELSAQTLAKTLDALLKEPVKISVMGERAKKAGTGNAAGRIYDEMKKLI